MAVHVRVPTLPVSLPACCLPPAREAASRPLVSPGTTVAQCHGDTGSLESGSAQSERTRQEKPLRDHQQQEPTMDVALWEDVCSSRGFSRCLNTA